MSEQLARPPALAAMTTLGVGGPAGRYLPLETEADLIEAVARADAEGEPLLVVGGGSNLVISDAGFPGLVVHDVRDQIRVTDLSDCGGASVTVAAGTPWDRVVQRAVAEGWIGIEALAGIPGTTGATPVQNVGAYGQEVAQTIAFARCWDRAAGQVRTLPLTDLEFGYRTSVLKRSMGPGTFFPTPRWVVLEVGFQFRLGSLSAPIAYRELARRLGVELGERAPMRQVRAAVLELRAGKGMVIDPQDADSRSAGSFFTNPILTPAQADRLPSQAPRFPTETGLVKTSAAWLIARSGLQRGWGLNDRATLSTKHVLALTNRGQASAADIVELARAVRDRVAEQFGIELVPEPVLVGLSLDSSTARA